MNESKKGKTGIIILIVVLVIIGIGVAFLFISDKQETNKVEKAMKQPAINYFNNYMSVNSGSSAYKITLGMLKEANSNGENYDLKALDGCSDEKTYALITIDPTNGKVKSTKITKNCKKW